jgi:hypothetical protein
MFRPHDLPMIAKSARVPDNAVNYQPEWFTGAGIAVVWSRMTGLA